MSLPSDERLWDAPDARSWEKVLQEIRAEGGQLEVPFLPMLHSVLNGGSDLGKASPFARAIVAHTVYRLVCVSRVEHLLRGPADALGCLMMHTNSRVR